jgi:two-component system sensor kinase FixL
MAAGMAHELSQPLTAIVAYGRGCLRLLAEPQPDPEKLKAGAREVVQQAERAGDVLVRLRDFVHQGASRRQFVAVRPLIDAAVNLVALEAAHAQVTITVSADPDLPLVFADNVQIEQVILNLLRNAVDALVVAEAEEKRILVEARRRGAAHVEISVTDSGPGIPEQLREKIFDPFVTTKPRGMGMGLSISQTFIEAHGGALRLAPDRDGGATFVFDLPTPPAEMRNNAG